MAKQEDASVKIFHWTTRGILLAGLFILIGLIFFWGCPYQDPYNPDESLRFSEKNLGSIVVFSLGALGFLAGMFSQLMFWSRRRSHEKIPGFALVGISARQGILLAILVVALLLMQGFRVLIWWDALLAVGLVLLLELYFLSR
jgi:hypothetical protein